MTGDVIKEGRTLGVKAKRKGENKAKKVVYPPQLQKWKHQISFFFFFSIIFYLELFVETGLFRLYHSFIPNC